MDFRVFSRNISENMHARCVREDTKQVLKSCEKISVNSTTVIKNDIASGLKNSRSIFTVLK